MPLSCSAYGCTNRQKTGSGLQFFRFPLRNPDRLTKWLQAVRRDNWKPSTFSRLCSKHFRETDFDNRKGAKVRKLNSSAIPSVFPAFPSYLQTKPISVRPPRKRLHDEESNISFKKCLYDHSYCTIVSSGNDTTEMLKDTSQPSTSSKILIPSIQQSTSTNDMQSPADLPCVNSVEVAKTKRITKLARKVKSLQQRVRRQKLKIRSMADLIKQLKAEKLLADDPAALLLHHFEGHSLSLFQNELKQNNRNRHGMRYSKELKEFALTLLFYSPKAYNYCRSHLHLPHPATIRQWTSSVNCQPGFMKEVFNALSKLPQEDQDCNLVIDGMSIRKQVLWDPKLKRYAGFVNYGEDMPLEDSETVATECLTLMLVGLKRRWKWPIAYFFITKMTANVQAELVRTALTMAADAGLRVWGLTCDGTFTNFDMMNKLGCKVNVSSLDEIKCFFKHPTRNYSVYFIPDACHMLKLARNALADYGCFKIVGSEDIAWQYIVSLCNLQRDEGWNLANRLNIEHVQWQRHKMKVKIAAQTLSSSVADALEFLKKAKIPQFASCSATIQFIRNIDQVFDFLNSRSPIGKGFKKPLYASDLPHHEERMTAIVEYLFSLQSSTLQPIHLSRRKTFVLGLCIAIKSTLELAKELLQANRMKYLLTYKFSQDHLELFFSCIRRRGGWNNNPNTLQFTWSMRQLLMRNAISAANTGNCDPLPEDTFGGIFELRHSRRSSPLADSDQQDNEADNPDITKQFASLSESDTLSTVTRNILHYIAGYIVRKLLKDISCSKCATALSTSSNSDQSDHSYASSSEAGLLLSTKDRGGLVKPSEDVCKVVRATEHMFKRLVSGETNNKISGQKHLDATIIKNVSYSLLQTNVFSDLEDHTAEELSFEPSHKLQIIKAITERFVRLRLFSYGKRYTREKVQDGKASERHRLTKLILFQHA